MAKKKSYFATPDRSPTQTLSREHDIVECHEFFSKASWY